MLTSKILSIILLTLFNHKNLDTSFSIISATTKSDIVLLGNDKEIILFDNTISKRKWSIPLDNDVIAIAALTCTDKYAIAAFAKDEETACIIIYNIADAKQIAMVSLPKQLHVTKLVSCFNGSKILALTDDGNDNYELRIFDFINDKIVYKRKYENITNVNCGLNDNYSTINIVGKYHLYSSETDKSIDSLVLTKPINLASAYDNSIILYSNRKLTIYKCNNNIIDKSNNVTIDNTGDVCVLFDNVMIRKIDTESRFRISCINNSKLIDIGITMIRPTERTVAISQKYIYILNDKKISFYPLGVRK